MANSTPINETSGNVCLDIVVDLKKYHVEDVDDVKGAPKDRSYR